MRYLAAAALLVLGAAALWPDGDAPAPVASSVPDEAADEATVKRGKYLADAGNCFSCHTREGGAPYAGGVPFDTPFGTIYSTNITPDAETGIGNWTGDDLRRAMQEGIAADGSRLFPAFPYPSYTKVKDQDIAAIYAYLRTLEPATYTPPGNSFLLRQRWALRLWNALSFDGGRFVPDTTRSAEWNRGAYLVEGLGHCGACHTPRNRWMAEVEDKAFHGGVIRHEVEHGKVRDWSAVDLTPAKNGLAAWSEQELTQYLHKGFSPRGGTFGPMNEVIVNSLMKLTPEDVNAMAVYLKSLPASEYDGESVPPEQAKAGEAIYEERCEECHSSSGRGGIFSGPPLAGSAVAQSENPTSMINIMLYGADMPDEVSYGLWERMQGFGDVLDDSEIAAVANYVRGSWGNVAAPITAEDVERQR